MSRNMEPDLCCSICRDVFREPVILTCSHSFCKSCLNNWWGKKVNPECPICKARSTTRTPPRNLALQKICELFLPGQEDLCSLHSEKFKLFCTDHGEPLCVICQHSDAHLGHTFKPIGEAAEKEKKGIRKLMGPLQEKLRIFKVAKDDLTVTTEYVKLQAQRSEALIREQFKKLHLFLDKEEEDRITALRMEESKKSQELNVKIDSLSKEIATLSGAIKHTERMLKAEDIPFLKSFKTTEKHVRQRPLPDDPKPVTGALIDVAKHLGNLTFNIWNKMKHLVSYTPVVLDPNTANTELILTKELTSVRHGQKQKIPDNPERFEHFRIVLGSEGFMSGIYSWNVEVDDSTDWFVGVASQSVQRKGKHPGNLWRIGSVDGKYIARALSDPSIPVSPDGKLKRVRVVLDWNEGTLAFFDYDRDTHLHTFTHSFTEKVFPYFNTVNEYPLKIIPEDLVVVVGSTIY